MQSRLLIKDIFQNEIDDIVTLAGWVHKIRNLGKIAFVILRDASGIIQCVIEKPELLKQIKNIQVESVIKITGKVTESIAKNQIKEIHVSKLEIISSVKDQIPIEINKDELQAHLDTIIDHRPITLRHLKQKAIFKIQAGILQGFRNSLIQQGFVEFKSPILMACPSESGSSVFEVNYYDRKAYLAQSPQIYKQIMVGVYERVFTVSPVFRAEKHNTSRHIMEITQMDAEVGFVNDYDEILQVAEKIVRDIIDYLNNNYSAELEICKANLPKLPVGRFPKLKVKEVFKILEEKIGKSSKRSELDLDPDDEREICKLVEEEHNSDFVWILNFKKDKNFYTRNNPEDPDESLSFDLLCRGLELLSGTFRINNYHELVENMKKHNITLKYYEQYLEAFRYGMPQEGGFSFGLERMTQKFLNLSNIREATLFPTDLDRIAGQRIS